MSNRVRFGLIAGLIGLVVNLCASTPTACLGPFVALIVGAAAGYFTLQAEPPTEGSAARLGASSGVIAGLLILVSHLIAAAVGPAVMLATQTQPFPYSFRLPQPGNGGEMAMYWIGAIGTGLCMGVLSLGCAAGGGALAGSLVAPEEATPAAPSV
jgi:hypothetical protein